MTRRNVVIDDATHAALKRIGGGNVSKGIREAVARLERIEAAADQWLGDNSKAVDRQVYAKEARK